MYVDQNDLECYGCGQDASTINLSKLHMRNLTAVIAGHWSLGNLAQNLKLNDFLMSYNNAEYEEIPEQFLCQLLAFVLLRDELSSQRTITEKRCLSEADLRVIHIFIVGKGWYHPGQVPCVRNYRYFNRNSIGLR